jgi:hypothetical protein
MKNTRHNYQNIAVSQNVGFGIVPQIIMGVSIGSKLLSAMGPLIGVKPRGQFQKFARNLFPYMHTAAAETNLPVYCMWFGDWVSVNPDGSYGVAIGKEITANGYYPGRAEMETYQNGTNPFYRTDGPKGTDLVNHPEKAYFELYDPLGVANDLPAVVGNTSGVTGSSDIVTSAVTQTSGISLQSITSESSLIWIALAGLAAYWFFGRKK